LHQPSGDQRLMNLSSKHSHTCSFARDWLGLVQEVNHQGTKTQRKEASGQASGRRKPPGNAIDLASGGKR
jgi:hypothetical protein